MYGLQRPPVDRTPAQERLTSDSTPRGTPTTILVVGPRGVGKTGLAQELSKTDRRRCRGIYCPSVLDELGRRIGIHVVNIATGERADFAVLARIPARVDQRARVGEPCDPADLRSDDHVVGPWNVRAAAVHKANAWLVSIPSTTIPPSAPTDACQSVCIIDEIGPWELDGGGVWDGVRAVLGGCETVVATVRTECAEALAGMIIRVAPGRAAGITTFNLAAARSPMADILAMLDE